MSEKKIESVLSTLKVGRLPPLQHTGTPLITIGRDYLAVIEVLGQYRQLVFYVSTKIVIATSYSGVWEILLNYELTDEGFKGESISINELRKMMDSDMLEELLQTVLYRLPELSESEKTKVSSSAEFADSKEAIHYYFKLLNRIDVNTYIRGSRI